MLHFKGWYFPDKEEHFIKNLQNQDEYQNLQRNASLEFLDQKRKAIDIGANVGLWARDLCKIFGRVELFEPVKQNIECLEKNLEVFSNFKIYDCALSNSNGFKDIYIDEKGSGNNSLIKPKKDDLKKEKIKIMKLDDFNFNEIDYIKIDVQFHELEVIEGGINTLIKNNPVLCIEAARRNEEELSYVKKWGQILESIGYKIIGGIYKELFFKK
tara:strand:- start:718 stop:1356 length:639 start_codon:yes stop_codon:yes gene_type:complete